MPRIVDPSTIKKGSGMANQNSVDANAFMDEVIEGQNHGLEAHLNDPQGAHLASAISTTGSGGLYFGDDVQENLDELSALVPPRPATLGNFKTILTFPLSGIPDWGVFKLRDAGFVERGQVTPPDPTQPTNDFFVYREWWWPPFEAQNVFSTLLSDNPPGNVFQPPGNDPVTDPTFNVADVVYSGGGDGTTHQAGFTRVTPVIETARSMVIPPGDPAVVVSGAVFPADRGVVALFRWPAGGDVVAFLAQPLETRVVAAILCGQGIGGDCDGAPGGIFDEGDPDVFAFPGRATGQFDLVEIHAGVNSQTGDPIPPGPSPSAGQVRLGTDPAAGPVIVGGIPILGGTSIATGGGNDNNFFRYRLPYLDDYSSATGIEFTPAVERPRYFTKPAISLNPGVDLPQAGDYGDFTDDYWTFQLARFRHRFEFAITPEGGSYILLHFRREADFEAFARDGIMPDDPFFGYPLWSAGMVDYTNPESTDNLIDTTDPLGPLTSTAYHVHRTALFGEPVDALVNLASTFDYDREVDEVVFVSGVQYFLPNGSGVGTSWQISDISLSVGNLWNNTYLLGNDGISTEVTPGLWHRPPVVLYLGAGTSDSNVINGLGPGYTGTAFYQRVDFGYEDLDSVSGPWDLAAGPQPADTADVVLTGADTSIRFAGDDLRCHFSFDARIRAFARNPLSGQTPDTALTTFLFPNPGLDQILLHTTSHSPSFDSGGDYGNFKTTDPGDFPPRANLENARKDVQEIFLDEVYRIAASKLDDIDPTWNGAVGNLVGPGLPFGALQIPLPVRFASEPLIGFGDASYLRQDFHLLDLASAADVITEAQVSGLPDRSPPAADGVENPFPFSGMLIYPQIDYTTGFRPSVADGDTTNAQFDYSAIVDPERVYLRVLDAAYANDASPEPGVVGQPFLRLKIDGLQAASFAYFPPGPGSTSIAIEIKIPGFTTWMDLGRLDGAGPSKQDALVDGAGCQVPGPDTFDGRDPVTGTVFCQVRANVGPATNVFANPGPVAAGVAPVLVRVRIKSPTGVALNFTQGGPGAASNVPRALTGITVLRHSNGSGPPPFGPPPFP